MASNSACETCNDGEDGIAMTGRLRLGLVKHCTDLRTGMRVSANTDERPQSHLRSSTRMSVLCRSGGRYSLPLIGGSSWGVGVATAAATSRAVRTKAATAEDRDSESQATDRVAGSSSGTGR